MEVHGLGINVGLQSTQIVCQLDLGNLHVHTQADTSGDWGVFSDVVEVHGPSIYHGGLQIICHFDLGNLQIGAGDEVAEVG